jgi:glycosyltransferase involved in cell wall biosynthesis
MGSPDTVSPISVAHSPQRSTAATPYGTRRTNVLHIIAPGEIGGAESVVRLLARHQQALGARVHVAGIVQSAREAEGFFTSLQAASVQSHRIQVRGRDYRHEQRAVAAVCSEFVPDVVHSHGYRTDVIDSLHVRAGVPIVTTVHGFTGGNLKNHVYQWLQCRAFRRFDAVVAVSEPLRRQIARRIGSGRVHLVANAYAHEPGAMARSAARAALGLPNEDFVIGWVGRFSSEKGADVLLEALTRAEMPAEARAIFIGDGPLATALRQRGLALGLGRRACWKGVVPNAAGVLSAFDVLVLSSRTEGTPMVLLEAMAAGTPIVATRVGGVPDMLAEHTALLVSPESPVELARAIREVFRDRAAASQRAHAARLRLEMEHGVVPWSEKYEGIYAHARARASQRLS